VKTPQANIVARVSSTDEGKARIEEMLVIARAEAKEMIEAHRHVVEAPRDALLERDELIGDEILEVITGAASSKSTDGAGSALEMMRSTPEDPIAG